ncbi:membrane protein complex subunit 9 [Seminavis robusta]|uniref:Membrane protein complex subunit 9 n=1 Tax=Seminavis robusta TaxID=568900 RepID=A0A9N8DYM6_9STRA|nr:membrane protein complex subunit 9 [Seminavis robusta]|eukprot:Sro381_g130910.1 membrane protein complex subunit 9 (210) ;mRNA; f:64576-65205
MAKDKETERSVEVSAVAAVSMILHAVKHSHEAVHGVLLGSFSGGQVKISEAVPVCHGAPTLPLLETALALIKAADDSSNSVVGWYVSPRLESDERPGPAALKIVAGLASSDDKEKEPALVVLRNKDLDKIVLDNERSMIDSFQALGKDFGQQWLKPLSTGIDNEETIKAGVKKALKGEINIEDLIDHFEAESSKKSRWFPNDSLKALLK